jgi:hypothetical protein
VAIEVILTVALVAACGAIAWSRGGPPERIAAAIIVGWIVLDVLYHLMFGPADFNEVDPVHLVLDGAELVAIVSLALRANRVWPLWAAAAQLICVAGHVAALVEPRGMTLAYWAMTQLPPFIQLIALVSGAVAHTRRTHRIGPYPSWRVA